MPYLKLPHNKVSRLLINIAFIVGWHALSGVIIDFTIDFIRSSDPEYNSFDVIHTVINFLLIVIPIAIITKFIWFKKSRITTSIED